MLPSLCSHLRTLNHQHTSGDLSWGSASYCTRCIEPFFFQSAFPPSAGFTSCIVAQKWNILVGHRLTIKLGIQTWHSNLAYKWLAASFVLALWPMERSSILSAKLDNFVQTFSYCTIVKLAYSQYINWPNLCLNCNDKLKCMSRTTCKVINLRILLFLLLTWQQCMSTECILLVIWIWEVTAKLDVLMFWVPVATV